MARRAVEFRCDCGDYSPRVDSWLGNGTRHRSSKRHRSHSLEHSVAMSLREGRRWLTTRTKHAGLAMAPRLSPWLVNWMERWLARFGPRTPILAAQVARNMQLAGVYSDGAFRSHFRQVAQHLANALRVFHESASGGSPAAVGELARGEVHVDASLAHLREALAAGRGAVIAPPHVCNYLLTVVRLSQEIPLCIYLRWSKDERKRAVKKAWCEAAGLRVILEPASATDPSSRAAACVDILRRGEALVMTPDIVQRAGRGVPVRLFDRTVQLPAGAASIAMLAESPLVPAFGSVSGRVHTMTFGRPLAVQGLSRTEGG